MHSNGRADVKATPPSLRTSIARIDYKCHHLVTVNSISQTGDEVQMTHV
jgi:hypothetical protein